MRTPFSRIENLSEDFEPIPVVREKYERCHFCHSKLVYAHDYNFGSLQVIETARCPGCGVSHSPQRHTLH